MTRDELNVKYCMDANASAQSLVNTYRYLISQTAKQNKIPVNEAADRVFKTLSKGKTQDDVAKIKKAIELVKKSLLK